jgi:intracellular septation protein A
MICFSTKLPSMAELSDVIVLIFGYLTLLFELLNITPNDGMMNY